MYSMLTTLGVLVIHTITLKSMQCPTNIPTLTPSRLSNEYYCIIIYVLQCITV